MLGGAITDAWQSAAEIAMGLLPNHSATKLLHAMAVSGAIESRAQEWIDERMRRRKRMLYRARQDMGASMDVLMRAFGMISVEMPTEADYLACRKSLNVRRHVLRG